MKKISWALVLIVFFCSALASPIIRRASSVYDTAVEIAIEDFLKCRLSKDYNAFSVSINDISEYAKYKISNDVITVNIFPAFLRAHITPHVDTVGSVRLPTRHLIKEGKLFCWYDPNYGLTEEMVKILFQFNIADSIDLLDPSITLDDYTYNYIHHQVNANTKGADYYFYRNDLRNYKRVITNIATGWYKPPKM